MAKTCRYVPDLGADLVRGYKWNEETGVMTPDAHLELELPPGSGPRHMVFHPKLPVAYVVNELLSTVSTCSVSKQALPSGTLCDLTGGNLENKFETPVFY